LLQFRDGCIKHEGQTPFSAYFGGELNKFIQAAENHARNEKTWWISFLCKTCKNMKVFYGTTITRLHVLVGVFVEDHRLWMYHGENATPPTDNLFDEIIQEEQSDRMFNAYDDFECGGSDDDGVGGFHGDGVDEGPIDGDSTDDELDDGDFPSQLLHHSKAELLVGSAKGLANFETVRTSVAENIYTSDQRFV